MKFSAAILIGLLGLSASAAQNLECDNTFSHEDMMIRMRISLGDEGTGSFNLYKDKYQGYYSQKCSGHLRLVKSDGEQSTFDIINSSCDVNPLISGMLKIDFQKNTAVLNFEDLQCRNQ